MANATESALIRLTYNGAGALGLETFADTLVLDTGTAPPTVCALRMGGEPEQVQAMTAIIQGGGLITAQMDGGDAQLACLQRGYKRQLNRDGPYTHATMYCFEQKLEPPKKAEKGEEQPPAEKEKNTSRKNGKSQQQDKTEAKELPSPYELEESDIASPRDLYFYNRADDRDALFSAIDAKTSVPMIPEFGDYLISELENRGALRRLEVHSGNMDIDAWMLHCEKDDENVVQVIEDGLRGGELSIPDADYGPEVVENVATVKDYLDAFGVSIAQRIREEFTPLFDPATEHLCPEVLAVSDYVRANAGYPLYDAQLAVAHAVVCQLQRSKIAVIDAECGIGKSKIGAAALYASYAQGMKRGGKKKTMNVVLCPAHLTGKWVREIYETIPNISAVIIRSITDVDRALEQYRCGDKSMFLVLNKEKARDGYMRCPCVVCGRKPARQRFGEQEEAESYRMGPWQYFCPTCGEEIREPPKDGEEIGAPADQFFFQKENAKNHKCVCCGAPLWTVLNPDRQTEWIKIGNYGFVHRYGAWDHLDQDGSTELSPAIREKLEMIDANPNGMYPAIGARRAYPLSAYIKSKLRGSLDCVVVDELQDYNNDSGQGDAMMEIFGVAKKFIGMTGTLLNGYSSGLFYLFYRILAHRMMADGKPYDEPNLFNYEYGVVQYITRSEEVEYASNRRANVTTSSTRQLPGVSPLVFSRFLMECTAFLTLKDLGKELPEYEEIPVPIHMTEAVGKEYAQLEKQLKNVLMKDRRIARRVQAPFFNLLTGFPDQPYGQRPIYYPKTKEILVEPGQCGTIDDLWDKDHFVMDKVAEKIAQGERVIIYTSWVRLDTQKKLTALLRDKGYSVQVLPSTVPTEKREEWVAKKVREGVQVLITNPTLVSTGLDLLAFTTFIYYDLGNKLFDLRQSSRRGYRINQTAPRIEVYLLYYLGTVQQNMMKLMASKLATANMIEGGYSEEGLAAMSETEDTTTILARELMLGIRSSVEDIGEAFKKMAILHPEEPEEEPAAYDEAAAPQLGPIAPLRSEHAAEEQIEQSIVTSLAGEPAPAETSAGRVYTDAEIEAVLSTMQRRKKKTFCLDAQMSIFDEAS